MDQDGHIYAGFVGKIAAEDVARLDGYLRGREDERALLKEEAARLVAAREVEIKSA